MPPDLGQLSPMKTEGIRHCSEWKRDVHLALTTVDFRRHADEGHCVAVRVLQGDGSAEDSGDVLAVGGTAFPYYSADLRLLQER